MKKSIKKVEKFHNKFGVENGKTPRNLSKEDVYLRCKLLQEELEEYEEAALGEDLVEVSDALGDQLYIVLGTILTHGMQDVIEEVFNEIHRSNMSKLGPDGKAIINGKNGFDPSKPEGKILKGKMYFEPSIKEILKTWL